jgi:hypothetical protein
MAGREKMEHWFYLETIPQLDDLEFRETSGLENKKIKNITVIKL